MCPHALLLPQLSQTVLTSERIGSEVLQHDVLMEKQRSDNVLSRVFFFVERGRRPSRRERAKEPIEAVKLLRGWDKLAVRDGVLFHVAKNVVTKKKTYLYIVPPSLRSRVLAGVHDEAGHQGQQRTLYLARQRFHWLGLSKDVAEYVRYCRRCVVSKSPEPGKHQNVRTS